MFCEICGAAGPGLHQERIEGAQLLVCRRCGHAAETPSSYGPAPVAGASGARARTLPPPRRPPSAPVLAEDYGRRIQQARARRGWTREELARRVFEKASHLAHIENQQAEPGDALIAKLERVLGISLAGEEDAPPPAEPGSRGVVARPTLADFFRPKKNG